MKVVTDISLSAGKTVAAEGCPVVGLPFGLSDRIGHSGWRRFASAAVTIGIHVLVVAAFCVASHEAKKVRPVPSVMTVSLLAETPKPTKVPFSRVRPAMVQPQTMTMPAPVFQTETAASDDAISLPVAASDQPSPGDTANLKNLWAAKLIARLAAMKRYPRAAVAGHQQGVVWLHFIIDRAGRVLSADIQKSSGFDALDKEALALAYRAQPLPKPPAALPGISFDLALPIRFALN